MVSVANLAVFPRIWACFFVELRFDLKTCWLLVFWLVSTEIYSFLSLFFADFCFSDCFFFKFYSNFRFQFAPKGMWVCFCENLFILSVFFSDLPPSFYK